MRGGFLNASLMGGNEPYNLRILPLLVLLLVFGDE